MTDAPILPAKVLKYFFKPADKPWNDPAEFSVEEKKLHDDYVAFVNSQEGYDGGVVKTFVEDNILKHTYNITNEWKAREFALNIHDETNLTVHSYIDMIRNKVEANNATDYTIRCAIEYANGVIEVVK